MELNSQIHQRINECFRLQVRRYQQATFAHQEAVAVRWRFGDRIRRDHPGSTRPVYHDDRLL